MKIIHKEDIALGRNGQTQIPLACSVIGRWWASWEEYILGLNAFNSLES